HAGVELLVRLAELGDQRVAQRPVRVGRDLGDDPAVLDVVGVQAEQVHLGRLDVGLVSPRALQVQVGDLRLAAVRAGRGRSVGRTGAVEAQVLDAGAGEADVGGVDLRRVVT